MAYFNPLHSPVPSHCQSSFSSLSPAQSGFSSPRRRRIPQDIYAPSSKWKASMSRPPTTPAITFDMYGSNGQGVPMRELCARSAHALGQMLAGGNDIVGAQRKVVFKICWPGYPHVDWTRSIDLATGGAPLTRAQLASTVAHNFARFVEKGQYETAGNPQWRLGPGGVTFDMLVLLSFTNVCDDVWMAEVAYDS